MSEQTQSTPAHLATELFDFLALYGWLSREAEEHRAHIIDGLRRRIASAIREATAMGGGG